MPLVAATILYDMLIALVTAAFASTALSVTEAGVNKAIKYLKDNYDLSDDDAMIAVANQIVEFVAIVGGIFIAVKSKFPLKVADRIGLTRRGWKKGALSTGGQAKLTKAAAMVNTAAKSAPVPSAAEATTIVATTKAVKSGATRAFSFLEGRLNTVFLGLMALGGWIDFGNWQSGAYSDSFQKLFSTISFGLLKPNEDWRQTKTASPEVFAKVYETYRISGAVAIKDPFKLQTVVFSRDALIDIVDQIGAQLLRTTGKAETKAVLLATQTMLVFGDGTPNTSALSAGAAAGTMPAGSTTTAAVPTTAAATAAVVVPSVKVFSGVVSQGTLGAGLSFTPRPDDLIESATELQDAAQNNIAPFLAALPTRVSYEISVVSSVTTKDGFTQRGTAQRIVSGYNKDGSPKYKTVVNKFAVADLYITTDKSVRTKLSRIILGPVDSVRLQITRDNLASVEKALRASITTTNVADVSRVVVVGGGSVDISVASTQQSQNPGAYNAVGAIQNPNYDGVIVPHDTNWADLWAERNGRLLHVYPYQELFSPDERQKLAGDPTKFARIPDRLRAIGIEPDRITKVQYITDVIVKHQKQGTEDGVTLAQMFGTESTAAAAPTATAPGSAATTLSEWYSANNKTLPSVEERKTLYEALGLGQAVFYTGTTEQNVKLLQALKERPEAAK